MGKLSDAHLEALETDEGEEFRLSLGCTCCNVAAVCPFCLMLDELEQLNRKDIA